LTITNTFANDSREGNTNTATNRRNEDNNGGRPVTSRLHPRIYAIILGLALWLVASAWLFAGGGLSDYLIFIVSGFIFVVVALQLILSRVGHGMANETEIPPSFRDWMASDFETGQGRFSSRQAALMILLPLAAAAFGMTVFGIALHVAVHGLTAQQPPAVYSSGSVVKKSG
jgi:hypothetical protein